MTTIDKPLDLDDVESAMLSADPALQFIPEDFHHFAPGVYLREMRAPAGAIIIGHTHLTTHLNILAQGSILVLVDGEPARMDAPCVWTAPPGRKVCYTLTDVIWFNAHPTEETDLKAIEDKFITKTEVYKDWETKNEQLGIGKLLKIGGSL